MTRGRDAGLVLAWLATRTLLVLVLAGTYAWVQGDLTYFAAYFGDLDVRGWADTLKEYPLPGVLVLAVPWVGSGLVGAPARYPELFVAMVVLVDAAFALLLRRTTPRGVAAAWMWVLGLPLLGVVTYARFDLVAGVLIGLAVLSVARRPWLAGVWAALATSVKLWPALVLMVVAAPRPRAVGLAIALVGGIAVALTVGLGGVDRLTTPLTYQSDRGLQVESVLATPAMLAWAWGADGYQVGYGAFQSFEVVGPGVLTLRTLTALATLLLAAGVVWLWARAWRLGPRLQAAAIGWCCLAATSAFVVSGKVLSPQYLLWLLPVAAAVVAVTRARSRTLVVWCALLLVAAALTQLVFPVLYDGVIGQVAQTKAAVVALAARNVLMVALTALAWREALRQTRVDG